MHWWICGHWPVYNISIYSVRLADMQAALHVNTPPHLNKILRIDISILKWMFFIWISTFWIFTQHSICHWNLLKYLARNLRKGDFPAHFIIILRDFPVVIALTTVLENRCYTGHRCSSAPSKFIVNFILHLKLRRWKLFNNYGKCLIFYWTIYKILKYLFIKLFSNL